MNTKRMRSRSVDSWLLCKEPPIPAADNGLGWPEGDALLWWMVVRQAARDVLDLRESDAYDAGEYLASSGSFLVEALFGVPVAQTREELARLIQKSPALREKVRGLSLS